MQYMQQCATNLAECKAKADEAASKAAAAYAAVGGRAAAAADPLAQLQSLAASLAGMLPDAAAALKPIADQ
eukprot:7027182-Pyramimonas_sp.AAC.1